MSKKRMPCHGLFAEGSKGKVLKDRERRVDLEGINSAGESRDSTTHGGGRQELQEVS